MKHCTRCQNDKPISDYYKDKNKKDGLQQWCKSCVSETQKLVRKENPAKTRAWAKRHYYKDHEKSKKRKILSTTKWIKNNPEKFELFRLNAKLKRYGISRDQYESLLIIYNFACGICGRHQDGLSKDLCIDHCHKTGKVRGLLCYNCNLAVGHLKDDPDLALSAAKYLSV